MQALIPANILAFCDASYSSNRDIAVVGFYVKETAVGEKPKALSYILKTIEHPKCEINGKIISGIKAAEIIGLELCTKYIVENYPGLNCVVYTDQQDNTAHYNQHILVLYIKGHVKKAKRTPLNIDFARIDRKVRHDLRKVLDPLSNKN